MFATRKRLQVELQFCMVQFLKAAGLQKLNVAHPRYLSHRRTKPIIQLYLKPLQGIGNVVLHPLLLRTRWQQSLEQTKRFIQREQ
jgi:hypothetical protein